MRKRTLRNWRFALDLLMIVVGCLVLGFGFSFFLEVNHLSMGGFMGLSMVINELLKRIGADFLSTSIIYLLLNIVLFVLAIKTMGKTFAIKAAVGILACSLSMKVFEIIPNNLQMELMISAIFGGLISGAGVGIAVMFGGSTGGSDMLGCIINHNVRKVSIGTVLRIVDVFVVLFQTIVFKDGFSLLPYTLIAVVIGSVALDYINSSFKSPIAYYIITSKEEKVSSALIKYLKRGCTKIDVEGMYTKQKSKMLLCIISGFQVRDFKNIVTAIDKDAFIYSSKVDEVIGNFTRAEELIEEPKQEYKTELNIKPIKKKETKKTTKTTPKTQGNVKQNGKARQRTSKS